MRDFTCVATWQGSVCVAFVIDAFARRIVGWRVSRTAHAGFVLDALEQALHERRPVHGGGLVHHTDRGCQGRFNRSPQHAKLGGVYGDGKTEVGAVNAAKVILPGRPPVWQRENLCRFWREVAAGLSSEDAAVEAGVSAPVGNRWFRSSGGMPPTHLSPSATPLKNRSLTFREREEIALECARGSGIRAIARKLGRSPSTISREIGRNSATRCGDFDYRAITAQWHADRAARRPKAAKLATNPALRDYVQDRLAGLIGTPDGIAFEGPVVVWKGRRAVHRQSRRWSKAWSPEQIARRLRLDFPEDPAMRISHEAIYQALYI